MTKPFSQRLWKYSSKKDKIKSLVLVMSGFHTLIIFLGVIGTCFKDAGLQDILIQSRVLANWLVQCTTVPFVCANFRRKLLTECLLRKRKKNVASTKYVYHVLPLDWNNESCYCKFIDSEDMKKMSLHFMTTKKEFANRVHCRHSEWASWA